MSALTMSSDLAAGEYATQAAALVRGARANGGLAPVDLPRFWDDQARARANPFGKDIPQVPLGVLMSTDALFDELNLPETPENWHRLVHDPHWRAELCRQYNDKAERIVGRRLLNETVPDPQKQYPAPKTLADLFEAKNIWHNESYWLQQSADDEDSLRALLDRVEKRLDNLRDFLLPQGWEEAKARLLPQGIRPPLYRWQRGPVTFATSVYGVENLIFLMNDEPELAARFSAVMLKAMLQIAALQDAEAGYTPQAAPHGFGFADDNCVLLTPEMYELFAYPILEGMFARYSPDPKDSRYQHSDSAMGHLLPLLGRLKLTGTNFGPTLTVAEIRRHLPGAVIDGQLAPFTLSRNEEENIVAEFLRDFAQARETRGLVFATAGSINNGSRLSGMRLIMSAIQRYGRYGA